MLGLKRIYDRLHGIDDPSVDIAMAAALATAEPAAVTLMARRLLQRNHREGTLALVLQYHNLPPRVRRQIVAQADALFRPLREATERRATAGPANSIEIIRRADATRLAYLLTDLLRRGAPDAKPLAAEALLEMAGRPVTDPAGAAYLQSAIEEAVASFAHHQHAQVLLAAASLVPRPIPGVMAMLAVDDHAAADEMRRIVSAAEHPAIRRGLALWLTVRSLNAPALMGLRRAAAAGQMHECLAEHHLLRIAPVANALAKVELPVDLCPSDEHVTAMPVAARRGLASWYATLPLEPIVHIQRLAILHRDDDELVRLSALRGLMTLARQGVDEGVLDAVALFCEDRSPAIARIALRELIRRHYPGLAKLLAKLVNSGHQEVRRLAGRLLGPIGFERLWEAWPVLDEQRRLAAGRALIKIDDRFHHLLADRLQCEGPGQLRALAMIAALNQGAFFEPALESLVRGRDEMLASAAVRAIGTAGTESAVALLEEALQHSDARVRANAVEALAAARSTTQMQKLVSMASRDEHRPRASAISALMQMKLSEALPALQRMLADTRPTHRRSALWLVDSMGLIDFAREVAEMSISDPDENVRGRADRIVHELIELMGSSAA